MSSKHSVEAWLDLARQAQAIANRMHDGEARRTMLEIAMRYEKLATRAALAVSQPSKVDDSVC
jgi:hypothetical protein